MRAARLAPRAELFKFAFSQSAGYLGLEPWAVLPWKVFLSFSSIAI